MKKTEIIENIRNINNEAIKELLLCKNEQQQLLFDIACEIRNKSIFKNSVELRSVIEISNICSQNCKYCSICNQNLNFYTLTKEELLHRLNALASAGRRTILLQSGEIHKQSYIDMISECISTIAADYNDMKIVLCLGNSYHRDRRKYQKKIDLGISQ